MCSALCVTRQGRCARRPRGPSGRDLRDAGLAGETSGVHEASRRIYGAPKVFAELRRSGERTSRKRVARIVRENGRAGTTRGRAKRPKGDTVNLLFANRDCGGNPGPNPSYATSPKSLRYCMGLL